MNELFEFNSGFYSIVTLYIHTFNIFNVKTNMLPSISHSCTSLIGEISLFNNLIKKHSEKITSMNGEKDKVKQFLDSFSRNLCWFIGMTAYKLIKVKDEKEVLKKESKDVA